jgi:hypothetical protein
MPSRGRWEFLGYQLRIPIPHIPSLWPCARREQYLLCPKTVAPLSADGRVWPLVDSSILAKRFFEDFSPGPNEAPNGLNLFRLRRGVANDLESLRSADEVLIALGTAQNVAKVLIARHFIVNAKADKLPDSTSFGLLGYDVCDETLLSGLMNCGLAKNYQSALRNSYGGSLNAHGLFDDFDLATECSLEISRMVPEHAPFFPVSLSSLNRA